MELWQGSPRERNLLVGLGALLLGLLLWTLVLGRDPAPSSSTNPADLDTALRDLQTVESALLGRAMAPASARAPFDRAALVRTSQRFGLTISRLQNSGDGAFTVDIAPAPTASVLGFLRALTVETDARITALSIDAADPPDVETRVTLSPEGAP